MKSFFITLIVFCVQTSFSFSQQVSDVGFPSSHSYQTIRCHGGLVIPHHSSMLYLIEDFAYGLEVNYGKRVFAEEGWKSYFNAPEVGFGFHYETFGNNDVYGVGYALFHYINYTMYRSTKLSVQNKIAAGLCYNTKPFDATDNIYNDISGSHLNVYISLGLNIDYRISDRFSLTLSGDLNHMSNGALKKPNSGINTFTTSVGTKYHFNTQPTPVIKRIHAPRNNQQELIVIANVGASQCATFNDKLYFNSSLSINYLFYLNQKKAIGVGFDQFYSKSAPYNWSETVDLYGTTNYSTSDYLFNGAFVSYNVFLGKTTMFVNLGAYLFTGITPEQPVYPRVGVRHQLTKNILASCGIKASFFKSEFIEFGLGYKFKTRANK